MSKLIPIIEGIIIAALLCAVIFLLVMLSKKDESEPVSAVPHRPPASVDAGEGEPDYYRTSGEKIYLNDPLLGEMYLPVLADVPACSREPAQMVCRNNLHYYLEDEKITSCIGVDVSAHQGVIDWETVRAAGVQFAIIRCGYRTYGSGKILEDEYFRRNLEGAQAAGLDVGVYFYSQAITAEEAVEEAKFTLDLLGKTKLTYPVVYDWEVVVEDNARTDGLPVSVLTACNRAFCDTVQKAGYTPMVYQNKRTSLLKLDLPQLTEYDFWLAEYNDRPSYYYDYRIWQYCSDGQIPGIEGDCDINICYKPYK